jgi:hypothetical protein
MIDITGNAIKKDDFINKYQLTDVEKEILSKMDTGAAAYRYDSDGELKFELEMRNNIIDAAYGLLKSRFRFRTFRESECNDEFWERSDEGGFSLRAGIKPSDGLYDIYHNGRKYGNECATAIVIIFYKALLEIYKPELFDKLYGDIYLMNWLHEFKHLGVVTYRDLNEYLPGDCRYFANPDVDPLTPEWQGENTIDCDNGRYYGHGIGISSAEGIIRALNRNRISGSEVSAYLMNTATRPNFKKLYSNTMNS